MSILNEVEANLENVIKEAVIKSGLVDTENIPEIVLENPKSKSHGDFATNIAMRLAKVAKKAPRQIAEEIVNHLNKEADRKSTRLNSSHVSISYAVFCLKKKRNN